MTATEHEPCDAGENGAFERSSSPDDRLDRVLLTIGWSLVAVDVIILGSLSVVRPDILPRVMAVIVAAFFGGRMPGILTGLELGLGSLATSLTLILLNTAWLLLMLPLFRRFSTRMSGSKLARRFFSGAERQAKAKSDALKNLGLVGLVFFIWLPFPLTGAFVGALAGLLMGAAMGRLVPVVLASMWIGVVTWTWGVEYVFVFTGPTGHIVAWLLTAGFLVYSVAVRFLGSRRTRLE
jgi:uncharacterized membrane protein